MERVTHIDKDGWYINGANVATVFHSGTGEIRMRGKDIDRLAAYEDTGMKPGDIKRAFNEDAVLKLAGQVLGIEPDRLRELAQADREGRCVMFQPGYAVVSIYNPADEDGLYTMKVTGVITKEEYEAALRREQE